MPAGRAQTIDRVDIIEAGIYKVRKAGTAAARDQQLLEATTTVPAKVGTAFGVKFVVVGRPAGARAKIMYLVRSPPLRNPTTGAQTERQELEWDVNVGRLDRVAYGIDTAWEAVPGEWALEFWHMGRKLGGQTFTLTAPK